MPLWGLRAVRPSTTHSYEEPPWHWVSRLRWASWIPIDIMIDSMGVLARTGKERDIEVKLLWVQEAVRRKRLRIIKILGTTNPADILTKPKSMDDIRARLAGIGVSIDWEVA